MDSQDFDTAQYLVNTFTPLYGGISPMKLQKMMYYLKAWGLVAGTPLVVSTFEKWEYGPVAPNLYNNYQKLGKNPIPITSDHIELKNYDPYAGSLLDFIAESYAPFHALTLSKLTHEEAPWIETPHKSVISDEIIRLFYSKQPFAENFNPFAPHEKPYYPVQSPLSVAFKLDMSTRDKEALSVYKSFVYYQERTRKAHQEVSEWMKDALLR